MTVFTWSQTAADNNDADSTVNWLEGQAPSTVNDSARAMMAAVAKWRDDMSGNLVTGGTSTAYTVTTNQGFTALSDGLTFKVRMSATSGANPTLNVDSLGAKAIAGIYGTAVNTGALVSGSIHTFTYDSTDDKWIVNDYVDVPLLQSQLNSTITTVDDLTELAAVDTTISTVAYLTEAGRENVYVLLTGDYSSFVSNDEDGYTYVQSDDYATTSAAWVAASSRIEAKSASGIGVLESPRWNYVGSGASAYNIGGGNLSQPNLCNVSTYVGEAQGDGSTANFNFSPGFTVANEDWENISVVLIQDPTRAMTLWSETTHYTVSGYGTGTITIQPNTTLTATQRIRVRISRKASSGNSPTLTFMSDGYDNVFDGAGPMVTITGAHHTITGSSGGHNTIIGGSLNWIHSSSSYTTLFGLSNEADGALSGFAAGMRNVIDGTAPFAIGASNKATSYSFASGEQCEAVNPYSQVNGRKGLSRIGGENVRGAGISADAAVGHVTSSEYVLRGESTSASLKSLLPVTGSSTWVLGTHSMAWVEADVFMVDKDTATADYKQIKIKFAISRDGSTTSTIYDKTVEVVSESAGASTWTANAFGSSSTGGFTFGIYGEASHTIQGMARVKVQYISKSAAAS